MLDLALLGPLRLQRGAQLLSMPVRKTQALLLLLALEGSVGRSQVCLLFWPALPVASARRNLRRELARLREIGAADAVLADGDLLRAAAHLHTDLHRAEQALARHAPEEALALWRGPLAEGLVMDDAPDFESWLAAARLRALRLQQRALEASAAGLEAQGDITAALGRMQALLAADMLNETHHREVMRLLAASGQREAALRQFDDCQNLLSAELGLPPSAATLALAQALRSGLPPVATAATAAASPSHTPTPQPPASPNAWPAQLPFVGRAAEVAQLQAGWAAGATLLITGPAGVGKSRLALDFVAAQGPYALLRCRPGDAEIAFGALARALRVLAGQPPDLRGLAPWIVTELARLLPELGPPLPPLQTGSERLRFDEACIQAWTALAGDSFDAVVLDDWHLADAASRSMLMRVAGRRREQGGRGCIEVMVCRNEDPALVQSLRGATDAVWVPLEPLPPAAVYELVQRLSGAADPARFASRLARATGGNAYFIAETLRDLRESTVLQVDAEGRWRTAYDDLTQDYRELPMARSVREAVLARVQRLGASPTRLLEAAALAGEPFGAALLASACALSELDALAALELAVQAQLVCAHEDGGYGWGHDLARQALDSSLTPAGRRLMHHRLALAAATAGPHAAAALHFEACGEPARAVPHRLAAGDEAHALHALAEAARHWHQGLADQPAPGQSMALLARLLLVEWSLGRPAEAQSAFDRLAPLLAVGAEPGPPPLVDAQVNTLVDAQLRAAHYLTHSGRAQAALDLVDAIKPAEGVALLSNRLQWLSARASALQALGRIHDALAAGTQALSLAPPASRERADALMSLAAGERQAGRLAQALARDNELIALCVQTGDDLQRAHGLYLRGCAHSELGDTAAAEVDLRAAAALWARFGNVYMQRVALYNLASNFSAQTRPDDALVMAREGWALSAVQPVDELSILFRVMFVESHFVRGEWGLLWAHAVPAIDEVLALGQPMSMTAVAVAVLEPLAVLGQWPRAQALLQAVDSSALVQAPQAGQEVWLACAQAALLQGDAPLAATWLARLGPEEGIEHQRARLRLALLMAEHRLAVSQNASDRAQVLAGLPADDAPALNDELRLRALTLRCRASADPAVHARARLALADARAHAAAALALERALGGDGQMRRVQRLAAGLADWPEVQTSFIATWS